MFFEQFILNTSDISFYDVIVSFLILNVALEYSRAQVRSEKNSAVIKNIFCQNMIRSRSYTQPSHLYGCGHEHEDNQELSEPPAIG